MNDNIVEIKNITIDYPLKKYTIRAVTDLSLNIKRGKITALVGESGSGKTTLATAILRQISEPGIVSSGNINFYSKDDSVIDIGTLPYKESKKFKWTKVSMVFQAAQSALNPVMNIKDHFYEVFDEHDIKLSKEEKDKKCRELLQYVSLNPDTVLNSYPHELSGGMKQRVMIAFSLLLDPELVILDEPTTALDVITQNYIFELLKKINVEKGISMLLLTHDISVVMRFADYIGVMYAGRLMEYGTVLQVFDHRYHPYTQGLIDATPSIIGKISDMKPIEGTPPDLLNLPEGCKFAPRCPFAKDICFKQEPDTHIFEDGEITKCHLIKEDEQNE